MKKYEVELSARTYRVYTVEAKNKREAEEKAFDDLFDDYDVSASWKENAKVTDIEIIKD